MAEPMKVLLTGGTGFLGEYLLSELLDRGHQVWALYRSEPRKLDTIRFLSNLGLPRSASDLNWFKGEILEINEQWDSWVQEYPGLDETDTILHSAASTRLHMDETGEPLRTNLGSVKALKELAARRPFKVHLVSTAYVCGLVQGQTITEVIHPRGDFVNVYEESKWEAEQLWAGEATMLRPAVIVGHSETGRCTSFSGWYILFQAVHLLDRLMKDDAGLNRLELNMNVPADPRAVTNIIPVDYVAKASIQIIERPENHGKIFHLTHPNPPTHEWTMDHICRRFNVGGLHFSGAGTPFTQPRNRIERMVWRQMQTILFHFSNNPIFDRANIDRALPNLKVPAITEGFVDKLLDYAIEHDWGMSRN